MEGYKYSVDMFKQGRWVTEYRWYQNEKSLLDEDLCFIAGKRKDAKFHGFDDGFPEIEVPYTFDWSLSFSEIEKKYAHPKKAPNKKNIELYHRETIDEVTKKEQDAFGNYSGFVKMISNKYGYVYELLMKANPDLPRWLYDNIINKKYESKIN